MNVTPGDRCLKQVSPELEAILTRGNPPPIRFELNEILQRTVWVEMRDGVRLSTDLYLPPDIPAPVLVTRTPYGRARRAGMHLMLAQCGYVVVCQDCRGTGESEPDVWEYYVYEPEDSVDCVEWIIHQDWCDGFVAGFGGSYAASTQWCMAAHPGTSTIIPEVGGLGVTFETARLYMYLNAYSRSIGKGSGNLQLPLADLERQMLPETLAGGYFNDPLDTTPHDGGQSGSHASCSLDRRRRTWQRFSRLRPAQRAKLLQRVFATPRFTYLEMERLCTGPGLGIAYGAHSIPSAQPSELSHKLNAAALLVTGWYDWNLNDMLASWGLVVNSSNDAVRLRSRMLITPSAHNAIGYREGRETHEELDRTFRTANIVDLLLHWYAAIRDCTTDAWPPVIYYLMGANEWRNAPTWPPTEAHRASLYLDSHGILSTAQPPPLSPPDQYIYDPADPTPTVCGSIVSHVYVPGSADVSVVQQRTDVLTYTTLPLERALDVVGPMRLILYVSSSAIDTDFSARLSDVFPDGRAIQLQSGMLRARYRNFDRGAEPLEPQRIYRLEIDMWATANRFQAGHHLRLDISSADFPRYDRNSNLGGAAESPSVAVQTVYHQPEYPSHLDLSVLDSGALARYFACPPLTAWG
jgi:putative CocE/NonD family hydrolase